MRILHAYNIHRGIGGADNATRATIAALREHGLTVDELVRNSSDLPMNFSGKIRAFTNGLFAAEAVREFSEKIADKRPDVVHVHELYPLVSPWIIRRAAHAGIPVFMSVYDYRMTCPIATHNARGAHCTQCMGGREHRCIVNNCRDNWAESTAYALRNAMATRLGLYTRYVTRFMAVSQYQTHYLREQVGIHPSRLLVNPCVVPAAADPVSDPSTGRYVGFAGRFVEEKGVSVMIEACRRARLPMRFAGNAMSHPEIRETDDAEFVITKSAGELAEFYRGARMLAVPSTWPETFGIVAAEAMGHGIPVVASRIGALQDTVVDGTSGILVEPGNAVDLANALRHLWDDPVSIRRLGEGAHLHVRENFSAQSHAERLAEHYQRAIDESASRH